MLIAQTKNHELVLAEHTLTKHQPYYCPSCQTPVHLKHGSVIRPHFAHFQNDTCEVFAEGETIEHIEGKIQLAEWLEKLGLQVEIEAYLPELQQRPDLLIKLGTQEIAIEFQCSPIAIEKVAERTKGYLNAGYQVIWVLGKKFAYKNNLTAFQKVCLSQAKKQLRLFHYHTEKKQLITRNDFKFNQNEKMACKKQIIQKDEAVALTHFEEKSPSIRKPNIQKRHQQLLRLTSDKKNQFLQLLYLNNENLVSMPRELYNVLPSEWMLQEFSYVWKFRFVLWLESFPKNRILTRKLLINFLQQMYFHDIPQASVEQLLNPIYEFLSILNKTGVVKEIGIEKWSIRQKSKRYQFLEEKFND